jgi:probable DNA metabolism protein
MDTLIYDNTWVGFLTAIFEIYDRKLNSVSVVTAKGFQPDVFGNCYFIVPDEDKAKRVWAGLAKKVSSQALNQLYSCYLSEMPGIAKIMTIYIRMAFDMEVSPESNYGHAAVLKVSQVDRMVHREKHRMEAFVRFQLTNDGLYYAIIDPDFNVLPLILNHFKGRYADQRWLIYDIKRDYGIYYDLQKVNEVVVSFEDKPGKEPELIFHDDEILYQHLWQDYFKNVNIVERKNTRLHLQHVPKRYWKHLTEKII